MRLDLPPYEAALIWVTATAGPLIEASAQVAAEMTARYEFDDLVIDPCHSRDPAAR